MRIYIACGLTHVPRRHFAEYTASIHQLADHLSRNEGHQVKYALVNSDPELASKPFDTRARLCYLWDVEMVREAEVVIAECSFPAIGLGIELQSAVDNETPIILAFRDFNDNRANPVTYTNPDNTEHELQIGDGYVSLMALGLPTVAKVHRYAAMEEGISDIAESVKQLQR